MRSSNRPPTSLLSALSREARASLSKNASFRKISDNIGWLAFDKILRMGLGILVGAWVARYLGPGQFGDLSYAIALVSVFTAIATLGLNRVVVRNVVREPGNTNVVLGTSCMLQLGGGLVAYILLSGAASLLRQDDGLIKTIIAIIGLSLVFKSADVVRYWFESQVKSRYVVWIENSVFLVIAAIKVALILSGAPLLAFVWAVLVEAAVVAGGLLVVYSKRGGALSAWRARFSCAKRLLRDSWPLILSGLAVMVYMRIDQIMLGQMIGSEAVGIYSAAARISEVWYFIPAIIVSSVFPSLVTAQRSFPEKYFSRLRALYRLLALVSLLVAIATTFSAPTIVVVLYGDAYVQGASILAVHVWALAPVALGVASSQALLLENLQRHSFYRTLIGCFANIALNITLIPFLEGLGAAIATVISYLIATFAMALFPKARPIAGFLFLSLIPLRKRNYPCE